MKQETGGTARPSLAARGRREEPDLQRRRIGVRSATSFPVAAYDGRAMIHARAVELSSTGIVIERGSEPGTSNEWALLRLQLFLPEHGRPVRALARPVRRLGARQALTFVAISDADRLTLVEHLDREKKALERTFTRLEA